MNIEERRMLAEPVEVLEEVPLDESNPEKFTKIRTSKEERQSRISLNSLKEA